MSCPREDEILSALERGFLGAELEGHARSCRDCGELTTVAAALLDDRVSALAESAVPAAGTMWWRMQLRMRQDAAAAVRRSLLAGQAVTFAVAAVLIGTLFGDDVARALHDLVAALRLSTPVLVALATFVLGAPIGGYLALRR